MFSELSALAIRIWLVISELVIHILMNNIWCGKLIQFCQTHHCHLCYTIFKAHEINNIESVSNKPIK